MDWIDPKELDAWAALPEAHTKHPMLVRRLVHATVADLSLLDVPSGSSVFSGGWDGRVETRTGNAFVPDGVSVWELSCRNDVATKANEDYAKRSAEPINCDPAETVYVFVTPRLWAGKSDWAQEKSNEKIWANVHAYDASDLAQWLEMAPSIAAWLSVEIGKLPAAGIAPLDDWWETWATITNPPISSNLLLAGRTQQVDLLGEWINGDPQELYIQASTKDEAVAFVAACAIAQPDWGYKMLSRALVVKTQDAWATLERHPTSMVLIPNFDGEFSAAVATRSGHHVLTPLHKADLTRGQGGTLPSLDRDGFVQALGEMGLAENEARNIARTTSRSMPVVRRKLQAYSSVPFPNWVSSETARKLMPALLVGQWEEAKDGEKEIVSGLGGKPYEQIEAEYIALLQEPDAPLRKIGARWRLVSHEEAWELLAPYATTDDFKKFKDIAVQVLSVPSPRYELPKEERYMAAMKGKVSLHSETIKDGIATTLALMGSRADRAVAAGNTAAIASYVVREILTNVQEWPLWATLGPYLATLAEAAPEDFLGRVEQGLETEPSVFLELFNQEGDGIFGGCQHSGLLWALERIAWSADYFSRAVFILARLAAIDPGGRYGNRPKESFRCLYLCWIRHSSASDEDRLATFDALIDRYPDIGWDLLVESGPKSHDSVTGQVLPDWRDWSQDAEARPTRKEAYEFVDAIGARLVACAGNHAGRWAQVVHAFPELTPPQRETVLSALAGHIPELKLSEGAVELWNEIRNLVSHHRQFPDADWSLPENELQPFDEIYSQLEPDDPITKIAWLFGHRPDFIDGKHGDNYEEEEKCIANERRQAVEEIVANHGAISLVELAQRVELPQMIGWFAVGGVKNRSELYQLVFEYLKHPERHLNLFANGASQALYRQVGAEAFQGLVDYTKEQQGSSEKIAEVYLAASTDAATWEKVEAEDPDVQRSYWYGMNNVFGINIENEDEVTYAAEKLLEYRRTDGAAKLLSHRKAVANSGLIIKTLEALPAWFNEKASDGGSYSIGEYEITKLFEQLDNDSAVPQEEIARLEIPFVSVLSDNNRDLAIHKEVTENASVFADLVVWTYRRSDGKTDDEDIDDAVREQRANFGWRVLFHLHRVPGQNDDNDVDEGAIGVWVDEARRLCQERGRSEIGDQLIGQILANSPADNDDVWPCSAVRAVLDQYCSSEMGRGFEMGKHNLRGVTSRAAFEGGDQERGLATKFRQDARIIRSRWPFTARILRSLADDYDRQARSHDDDADWRDQGGGIIFTGLSRVTTRCLKISH